MTDGVVTLTSHIFTAVAEKIIAKQNSDFEDACRGMRNRERRYRGRSVLPEAIGTRDRAKWGPNVI